MPGDPQLTHLSALKQPHGNPYRAVLVTQGARTFALAVQIETVIAISCVDVTNPLAPFVANLIGWGDLDGTGVSKEAGFVYGIATNAAGTRCYIGHQGQVGVFDISALPAVSNVPAGPTPLLWDSLTAAAVTFLRVDGNSLFAAVAGHGLYTLSIADPNAITLTHGPVAAAGDDGRYLPITGPVVTGAGTHVIALGPPNTALLYDVTNPNAPALTATVGCQTATTPTQATSAGERQAQAIHLTPTRLYTVEGNASPPTGGTGTNRCTVRVRSIDAAEGGSLSAPLLLGSSPFQEPEIIHMQEFTRLGRRYLLCTCCMAYNTQTIQGTAGTWSGRTLLILDVENPASISVVGMTGPPFAGNHADLFNPAYQCYTSVIAGNYAYTASYQYGLLVTDLTSLTAPVQVARVLLSGEGRHLSRRGNLLAIADAISTFRLYDVTNPEAPGFLGNHYSGSECFQYGVSLPLGAPGWAWCAGVVSSALETVNVQNTAAPVLDNVLTMPLGIFGMDGDIQGGPTLVVWGHNGISPGFSLVDISNPQVPVILSSRLSDATNGVRCSRCLLDGSILYFSTWGTADGTTINNPGVRIYDVTDRTNPILIASILDGPILIADMAIIRSGARKFLVTVPRWDSAPTATVLARGGLWVYEVTDPANPVMIATSRISHTALVGQSNVAMIAGSLSVLPGFLMMPDYYSGMQGIDTSNATSLMNLGPLHYYPTTHYTFSTLSDGQDVWALTISDLHIYRSAAVGPPTPPAAPQVQFLFSEVADAGSLGAEALTGAWLEVRSADGITLLAEASGADLLNYGGGYYGAPSLPWPVGRQAVMTRFHPGTTPDQPSQRVRNLIEFAGAID